MEQQVTAAHGMTSCQMLGRKANLDAPLDGAPNMKCWQCGVFKRNCQERNAIVRPLRKVAIETYLLGL